MISLSSLSNLSSGLALLTSAQPSAANLGQSIGAGSASNAKLAQSPVTSSAASKAANPSPASTSSYAPLTVEAQVSDGQVTGVMEGDIHDNTSLYSNWQDFIAESSMTSQQLSEVAYSGAALSAGDGSWSQTFVQVVNAMDTQDVAMNGWAKE